MPGYRDIALKFTHIDLADLRSRETGFTGQRAKNVAGADLVFSAAKNLQGGHGGQQRAITGGFEFRKLMPFNFVRAQFFGNIGNPPHLVRAGQTECPTILIGAAGAANAMDVDLGVGRYVDVNDRFKLRNVETARGYIGGDQN